MNNLYPLKFKPILKEKLWGGTNLKTYLNKKAPTGKKIGESWEISGIEDNVSVVDNGFLAGNNLQEIIEIYMGDLLGDRVYEQFGNEFPLLIKYIDAKEALSVQVHPDDTLAIQKHGSFGKTEMWFIIHAEEGAELISGFKTALDKEQYLQHLGNNELPKILNYEKVSPGDVFFIPAGHVHAIGAGVILAEIQQTSDITYRIYDWDRKDQQGKTRELHTTLALDAIDFKHQEKAKTNYSIKKNQSSPILESPYFKTNIIVVEKETEMDYNLLDTFVIYMCIEGKLEVQYNESETIQVEMGETILIPAVIEHIVLKPVTQCKILEVYIPLTDERFEA